MLFTYMAHCHKVIILQKYIRWFNDVVPRSNFQWVLNRLNKHLVVQKGFALASSAAVHTQCTVAQVLALVTESMILYKITHNCFPPIETKKSPVTLDHL